MVRPRITAQRPAGPDHAVLTLEGGTVDTYRRAPCATCPWREDAVGLFPPEAFVHAADVAYDASLEVFACHESGTRVPATCAGFLLRNSVNNLAVRVKAMRELIDFDQITDGGAELFESYRAMSLANGVDAAEPRLQPCRADHEGRS